LFVINPCDSSLAGIQLAHAGRKASTPPPFFRRDEVVAKKEPGNIYSGWDIVGASEVAFDENWLKPHQLTKKEIADIIDSFVAATKRAEKAGFDVIEVVLIAT
jgi:2,4-dienoyl-CoA reductase-like NADH-dependent reductase (Old Yellow Enzyme family)